MTSIKVWPWVALVLAALVLLQQLRVQDLQVDLAQQAQAHEKAGKEQAEKAQVAIKKDAGALLSHADITQDNVYEYTQTIQDLQARRTRDAADIAGLQRSLRATATQHAQAASDLDACRSLGDRHQQLAALAAEGTELVGQGLGLVDQRDAEVTLLKAQVLTERGVVERLLSD